eukprot:1217556-Pyramimonas_sp.AAC.3
MLSHSRLDGKRKYDKCDPCERLEYLMQIGLHELEDHVDIIKVCWARREHDVPYFHDIRMLKVAEKLDLTQYTGGVRNVFKHVRYFFYRHLLPGIVIRGRAHDTITALAHDFEQRIPVTLPVLGKKIARTDSFTESPFISTFCGLPVVSALAEVPPLASSPAVAF